MMITQTRHFNYYSTHEYSYLTFVCGIWTANKPSLSVMKHHCLFCTVDTKTTKAPSAHGPCPSAMPARTLPDMYGWALHPAVDHQPPAGQAASKTMQDETAVSARPQKAAVQATSQQASLGKDKSDICTGRRVKANRGKAKVRYPPLTSCQFVSCGPTKPLRTFREKPDSCLPRRK